MSESVKKGMVIYMKQRLRHLIYFIILILIDQVTKYWAKTDIREDGPFTIIPKVLKLQYHQNDGAVWGILSGRMSFLIILTVIMIIILTFFYLKIPSIKRYLPIRIIWVFIMAGAVGNFIDRIRLGYVVDFIYFELIDFPLFNLADSYLTVSCVLLLILAIFYYKDKDFEFIDTIFTTRKASKTRVANTAETDNLNGSRIKSGNNSKTNTSNNSKTETANDSKTVTANDSKTVTANESKVEAGIND
ncbi:MAG TPA: signal peptidase II [Mobilitalea sp.]|nr:signal peptidase II [Mobilitalea sp.]